jgi:hypothetical protein
MPDDGAQEADESSIAYEHRSSQLYEARGALADAVAVLREELNQRRQESAAVRQELARLFEAYERVLVENRSLHEAVERAAALERELMSSRELVATHTNMKVVRWTAPVRRAVYRLRRRLG